MHRPSRQRTIAALVFVALAVLAAVLWLRWQADRRVPQAARPLTLAVSTAYPGSGLIAIAADRGYFGDQGLQVTVQPHTSGRMALEAMLAGRADMATAGDTPFMFAVMRGSPVVILGTLATVVRSHGVVARRDRGIGALADLQGKTVGLTVGTDADYLLSVLLAANRVEPKSVRVVPLKPEEIAPALTAGAVDAVAGWDPWLSLARLEQGPQAVSFFAEQGFAFWFHLAGRRDAVVADPGLPVRVLRALASAQQFLKDHPQEGQAIVAAATAMDPAMFAESWPRFDLRLKLPQAVLTLLEDQTRWAQANGHLGAAPMPNYLDSIYLPAMLAVQPESVSIVR